MTAIVVDAHEVERSADELHVAGLNAHQFERIFAGEGFGVLAVEGGVEEPDVSDGVSATGGEAVGFGGSGGLAIGHAESSADLQLGIDGFDGAEGLALGDVDNMAGAQEIEEAFAGGGMRAVSIAELGEDERFVEDAPMVDTIAQSADNHVDVVGKTSGEIAIGPAAVVFKGLGKVPVIERAKGADFGFEKRVGKTLVVIEAFGIR